MSRRLSRSRPLGPVLVLGATGAALSLLPCLSRHDAASWSVGIASSLLSLGSAVVGRGVASLVAILALAHLGLIPDPTTWLVMLMVTTLAGYLAVAETVESSLWRAGARVALREHAISLCMAVAGAAMSLLFGHLLATTWPSRPSASLGAAVVGVGAAAALIVLVSGHGPERRPPAGLENADR